MEFYMIVGGLLIVFMVSAWRNRHSLDSASDETLTAEIKRRAYHRKMKQVADAEVEATLR